jgi:hypothetical protein
VPYLCELPAEESGVTGIAGQRLLTRAFQTVFCLGSLGALAHESFGRVEALWLCLLLLPVLAWLATLAVCSRRWDPTGGLAARDSARSAALVAPLLALPGALLGWPGVGLAIAVGACVARGGFGAGS